MMRASICQGNFVTPVVAVSDEAGRLGDNQFGFVRSGLVCHCHAPPVAPVRRNVLNEQDSSTEIFVEDAGLKLERHLAGCHVFGEQAEPSRRYGRDPNGQYEVGGPRENSQNQYRTEYRRGGQARGPKGDAFTVGGHSAQSGQNADQQRRGDRERQSGRNECHHQCPQLGERG